MSGNPFIGNTSNKPYREATYEIANELHVKRMNQLHCCDKNDSSNYDDE